MDAPTLSSEGTVTDLPWCFVDKMEGFSLDYTLARHNLVAGGSEEMW